MWTADLKRIRFCEPKVAEYYGGSVFQHGESPAVLAIREAERLD